MHQYICPVRNSGMTLERELHIRGERSISLKFQKRAFLLSKELALLYQEKIGFVEAPHKWRKILIHWYVIDTIWPSSLLKSISYTWCKIVPAILAILLCLLICIMGRLLWWPNVLMVCV